MPRARRQCLIVVVGVLFILDAGIIWQAHRDRVESGSHIGLQGSSLKPALILVDIDLMCFGAAIRSRA